MAGKESSKGRGDKSAKGKSGRKAGEPAKGRPKGPSKSLVNCERMKALSNEDRVQVFAVLCERVASPKEISEELDEPLGHVSYHVLVLRNSGLIVLDHKVPRRGAVEHFYRAVVPTLVPPSAWANLSPAVRKMISLCILQEFFEDVSASIEAGVFDAPPGELSWTPLLLDELGVGEFGQLARDFLDAVLELQANATKRLPKGAGKATDATSATIFLASFLSARDPRDGRKASATKRR